MNKQLEITCPLGHSCETSTDKVIKRCAWYTQVRGKDPQSEKEIDEWGCAMGWLPVLLIENAQTNRGQTVALESFRNEMVNGQAAFVSTLALAAQKQKLL